MYKTNANNMFVSGEIDYIKVPYHTVSADMIDYYKANDQLQIGEMAAFYNYIMNMNAPQLASLNIRKALALAVVNRQELIQNITKANQTPATRIIGPTAVGASQEINYFKDTNFDQARQYLAQELEELSLKNPHDLTLTMTTNLSEKHSAIAQYLQKVWKREHGVDVQIQTTEWQVHLEEMPQRHFQLGRHGEDYEYMDIAAFVEKYCSNTNGSNHTDFQDKDYQDYYDQAQETTDPSQREELLLKAEAIFIEEMPVVPLFFYSNPYVIVKDNIKNTRMDLISLVQLKYATKEVAH